MVLMWTLVAIAEVTSGCCKINVKGIGAIAIHEHDCGRYYKPVEIQIEEIVDAEAIQTRATTTRRTAL